MERCINCLQPNQSHYPCPQCAWSPDKQSDSGLYLAPGTLLHNQYQIAKVLGHGGFGVTYLAWDTSLQIKLAIKEYMPRDFATRNSTNAGISTFAGDAKENFAYGLERFLEEARTLAQFQQHAGIVSVLNYFKAHDTGYMVMEYVDGFTLKDYLANKGNLTWNQTLQLFMPVMDALREVHKHGLLHRDIAPDNIYLCKDNRVKLLDFGSARYALGGHSRSLSVVVKPGYAPEEQYRAKGNQGAWTDVYSVAASMYSCITGIVPSDALDRLDQDEMVRPSKLGVQIPAEDEQALIAALAVKGANRTQSIEQFQQALWEKRAAISNKESDKSVKSVSFYTEKALGYFNQKLYEQALTLFQYAAEQGDASAQNYLGYMYSYGRGVQQDYQQALLWFQKASDQGYANAQFNLGVMYDEGQGVSQDYQQAKQWYRKAAKQGNIDAQTNLVRLYEKAAKGVKAPYVQTDALQNIPAYPRVLRFFISFVVIVLFLIFFLYISSITITDQQTSIEEGIKYYQQGNYAEALKVIQPAAEQGYANAQNNLGVMYQNGQGVQKDDQQAVQWYRKAAEQSNANAESHLGYMYEYGQGVPQDYQQAVQWYRKATDQGNAMGCYNLGNMYANGQGVQQDYQQAVQWYQKAAKQDGANSENVLNWLYANAEDGEKDINEAIKLFRQAAKQGDKSAIKALKELGVKP